MKPNCYKCKYRSKMPGDAHICCKHPKNGKVMDDPYAGMMAMLASVGRVAPTKVDTGLNVKGNPHGIKNGWFNWPFNFDPIWLEACDGFDEITSDRKGG